MAITDIRQTVLEIINAVRVRQKLSQISSLTADSNATVMLDLLNKTVSKIVDYGDWQETVTAVFVTAQYNQKQLNVNTTNIVKNIHEIAFYQTTANPVYASPLTLVTIDDIRRLQRANMSPGLPRQWAPLGVDSLGNPKVQFSPPVGSTYDGQLFNILFYKKPPIYTTSDADVIPPFDAQLLIQGLYAEAILEDSDGDPSTPRYVQNMKLFTDMLQNVYNRFHGDSGSTTYFRPKRR